MVTFGAASSRYQWMVFSVVSAGVFMAIQQTTMVAVALPDMSADFGVDLAVAQWVILIYLLVIGAVTIPMGRAADLFGRKGIYQAGVAMFVVGSLLCLVAQDIVWLLFARGVQAIGSASLQANGLAINFSTFPEGQRGRVLGIHAMVVSMAAVSGPALGGLLTDVLDWRLIFLPSAVIGLVAGIVGQRILREDRLTGENRPVGKLDWPGMGTSAIGITAMLLVLSRGHAVGWTSPFIVGVGSVAAIGFMLFFMREFRATYPMLDLTLFGRRSFAFATSAGWMAQLALMSQIFLMPFYFQGVLRFEPREVGLLMSPMAIMIAVSGPISGWLYDRVGPRAPTTAGLVLACIALLGLSRLGPDSGVWEALVPLAIHGAGTGLFLPSNNSSMLDSAGREQYGVATGLISFVRNTGQLTGIAILTLIITLSISAFGIEADFGALGDDAADISPQLMTGFVDGMERAFWFGAGMTAIAAVLSAYRGPRRSKVDH